MVKSGLLRREKAGVKLLGGGELKAKLDLSVWAASKSAVAAVEKAGGSVKILAPAKEPATEERRPNKYKPKPGQSKKGGKSAGKSAE